MGFDPATIAIGAGMGLLQGMSGKQQAKDRNRAAQTALNAPVNMPEDLKGPRAALLQRYMKGLTDGVFSLNTPQINALSGMFRERMDPGFFTDMMQRFDPNKAIEGISASMSPLLAQSLQRQSDSTFSRFGRLGHRAGLSSDLQRTTARESGDAGERFYAGLSGLYPQLQQAQLGAGGLALQGQGAALQNLLAGLGSRLNPITAGFPIMTAGVGGTNASAYTNLAGNSPQGSLISGIGSGLGLLPGVQSYRTQNDFLQSLLPTETA